MQPTRQNRCIFGLVPRLRRQDKNENEKQSEIAHKIPFLSETNAWVNDRWALKQLLHSSAHTLVYMGESKDRKQVAVKVSRGRTHDKEVEIYSHFHYIAHDWGLAKVHDHIIENGYEILVLDLLGPSLQKVLQHVGNAPLSLIETIQLIYQLTYRLETLHNIGIIHGNIEPGNILIGRADRPSDTVFLVDFTNACAFRGAHGKQKALKQNSYLKPISPLFAPIARHERKPLSMRDDLESLMYLIVYMFKRSLPWENVKHSNSDSFDIVKKMKMEIKPEKLFSGLPSEFVEMYNYIMKLRDGVKPLYHNIRILIGAVFEEHCN